MKLKNTSDTYGLISKIFHWPMALIIMGLIVLGIYMADLEPSPDKYALYPIHKSFGLLILWMIGLRILWRSYSSYPSSNENHKKWERTLSHIVHIILYIAMIAMPVTGWLMSSAGGHAVAFFGLPMPSLMDKDIEFGELMEEVHATVASILIGAIFLHVAGALKHHFIDGDNTLKRMAAEPMQKIGPYIIIILFGLFAGALAKLLFLS